MPKAELKFKVNSSIENVWDLFTNLNEIGLCFAFIEKTEKFSENKFLWTVKGPMASLTRTEFLEANLKLKDHLKRAEFQAKGKHLDIKGHFEFISLSPELTEIDSKLTIEASGLMGAIINPIAAVQIASQLQAFANNIKNKIEAEKK